MFFQGFQLVMILVFLVLGTGVGIFLSKKFKFFNKQTKVDVTSTVKQILPASEYVSLVYHYSDVVMHSDSAKFLNIHLPFTGRKAIYSIDGTIKLGFNGKEIRINCSYDVIVVYMPKITILSHEMHHDSFKLYDETTGLFNKYDLQTANDLLRTQKEEIAKKVAADDGLLTQAQSSAEQQFKAFLENMPGIRGKYSLAFKWT